MIAIEELAPQTLRLHLIGKIAAGDLEALEARLDPYLEDEGSVNAVIDLSEPSQFDQPTATDAVSQRLLAQLDKLGRVAIVGARDALPDFVQALDAVMPPGQLGRFDLTEWQTAQRFASGPH
jgi:SpoIIAA-like